jgi:glycosyltransferase involved in cell wall biosynthesis
MVAPNAAPTSDKTSSSNDVHIRSLQIGMWWQTSRAGGLDRVFESLANHLPAENVDVLGIVQGPQNVSQLTNGKIRTFPEGSKLTKLLTLRKALAGAIIEFSPDIVASHFAFYLATAIGTTKKGKIVSHFHGPWSTEAEREGASRYVVAAKRLIEQKVYNRSDCIITLSTAFSKLLTEQFAVREDKIVVIPGGVDIDRFAIPQSQAEARRLLNFPTDRPILVSVRRLVHRMGFDRLIIAMQRVAKAVPDILLYIAGEGPLAGSLARKIRELDLERNIKLYGFVPEAELPLFYRAADINILSTIALEGFGLTAIESLAAGTPSMVTPVGGLPEVVTGLSKDLLFRSSEPNDLADSLIAALTKVITLPDSQACMSYASTNFGERIVAKRVSDTYRSLL